MSSNHLYILYLQEFWLIVWNKLGKTFKKKMNCFLCIEAKGRSFCNECLLKFKRMEGQKLRYTYPQTACLKSRIIEGKYRTIRLAWKLNMKQKRAEELNENASTGIVLEIHEIDLLNVPSAYYYIEIKWAIISPQTKLNMREKYGSLPKQLVFLGVKQDETVMYRNSPSTLIDIVQENL